MKIILIGFMGSGKSTVAQHLSPLLGFAAVEMDELVYQKTKTRNMHEVFALGGEALLREMEMAIAKEYRSKEKVVISTGGGVVLNSVIFDFFKETEAKVIFLRASWDTIANRLENDRARPLFKNGKQLYDLRLPLYLHYADETIDVEGLLPEQIAERIVNGL